MKTQLVTLTNDFHNSSVTLRCEVLSHIYGEATIRPNRRQIAKAARVLCGIKECTCGQTNCRTRGRQTHNGKVLEIDESAMYAN